MQVQGEPESGDLRLLNTIRRVCTFGFNFLGD